MTNIDRWNLYENGDFRQMIAINLFDWAGYWATAGVSGITDPLLQAQTKNADSMILEDPGYCIKIVAGLLISDDAIKNAENEITEDIVAGAVTRIMSFKLAWLTGIHEV